MTQDNLICPTIWHACEKRYTQEPREYLVMQEEHGVNVNLLLLAEELDQQGLGITADQWQKLTTEIKDWEMNILTPYRRLRKLAKASFSEVEYQKMLDVELMMERKAQKLILLRLNKLKPQMLGDNLKHYLSIFRLEVTAFKPESVAV